jgi:nucleoside-diphosphate-sugar epimerase
MIGSSLKDTFVDDTSSTADHSNAYGTAPLGPDNWASETIKDIEEFQINPTNPQGPWVAYHIAKTVAEKRVWQLADEHPEVDISTSKFFIQVYQYQVSEER